MQRQQLLLQDEEMSMRLSARNQIAGRITAVQAGAVMAEVTIDIGGGNSLVAAITRGSVDSLALKVGDQVTAIIKATEIVVGK
jgi:molybdate transport system regulatory protein